jgi:hypothetical protein
MRSRKPFNNAPHSSSHLIMAKRKPLTEFGLNTARRPELCSSPRDK